MPNTTNRRPVELPTVEYVEDLVDQSAAEQQTYTDEAIEQVSSEIPVDFRYTHTQGAASDTWTITHGLHGYPNVTVVTSSGDQVEGDVHYNSNLELVVFFSAPFSGSAYLS